MKKIQKIKGFFWVRYAVFDNVNLSSADILVYCTLMRHMNNKTCECFPSIKTLMVESRLSNRTIYSCLDKLESEKLIHRQKESGKVNLYTILEPPTNL